MSQNEELKRRPVVSREYGGKWVAWSTDRARIAAAEQTLRAAQAAAEAAGEKDPAFEWIPPANVRLVGGAS